MFFFISLDDYFDGASSTIGLIIKGILALLFVGLPIAFFNRGGLGVILALLIGLSLSVVLLTLFCIMISLKIILNKKIPEDFLDKKNKERNSKIYLVALVIISLISLLLPNCLTIFNYQFEFSKVFSIIISPVIIDILYIFYLYGNKKGKDYKIGYRISSRLLEPLKKLLQSLIIPTFICYWIILLFYLGANGTPKIHDIYNNMINTTSKIFTFYNNKYDNVKNNESIVKIIEDRIANVSKEKIYNKNELEIEESKFPELFWNDKNDTRYYTYSYIDSKAKVDNYFKDRGIKIKNSQIIDENTIYLEYYDYATLKENVVKFNLKDYKVINNATYLELDNQFYTNNKNRLNN